MAGCRTQLLMFALLALFAVHSAAAQCTPQPGYLLKADTNWLGTSKTRESHTSPAGAQKQCTQDPSCLAWNSYGYTISSSSSSSSNKPTVWAAGVTFNDYEGLCTYVKTSAMQKCPDKAGYVTKADTNWIEASTGRTCGSQTSAENAEKICNLDDNCLAWHSYGYHLNAKNTKATVAATGLKFYPYEALCTY
jgi:hypothetical protein